ncbi:hypothetical protein BCR43DRAFT_489737 [Syncephalastrum racemosum]|uniref:Uncharacterized protein n=1 Tax=Syncephalastrum racemosum TaxID=13706 RepID=A0A1X2HER8_SYNRA|nr:hypothetical protein BCR43DRAFT_489737 [Syncephalastrum racemosum]
MRAVLRVPLVADYYPLHQAYRRPTMILKVNFACIMAQLTEQHLHRAHLPSSYKISRTRCGLWVSLLSQTVLTSSSALGDKRSIASLDPITALVIMVAVTAQAAVAFFVKK